MDAPAVRYARTSDGFEIAYAVSGQGRPIVLMPAPVSHIGIEWSSATYRPLLEAMAARYRLIQYDSRGSGMSSRGLPETFSGDDYLTDLDAVLDAVGLRRFVLVGRLVSGSVGVRYAWLHRDRVEALVLWNANTSYRDSFAHSHLELARTHWEHVLGTIGNEYFPRDDPTLRVELARQCVLRRDFIVRVRAIGAYSIQAELTELRVPVLVIGSRAPDARSELTARRLASSVPGASLQVFDARGGIDSQGSEPPPAVVGIDRFLESLEAPTPPVAPLTDREIEVLRLVAAGNSNRQIAEKLVISPHTVARHLSNILTRVGAANRAEAVAYASRHHLI